LHARDAGLRRVSTVTRVAVFGSVAAAGGFTAIAAWAQPGRAKTVNRSSSIAAPAGQYSGGAVSPLTTPTTVPAAQTPVTDPATVAPSNNGGYSDGYSLSPPATLPYSGYQYSGPAVVSGAS
jgi:hypothetical protein